MKSVGFSSMAWNKSSERSKVARSLRCVAICDKQARFVSWLADDDISLYSVCAVCAYLLCAPRHQIRHQLVQSRIAPHTPQRSLAQLGLVGRDSLCDACEVELQLAR